MSTVEISRLTIYPLKSTKGHRLNTLQLTPMGPQWDRRWMLVDSDNRFLTQRQYPSMCRISTEVVSQGLILSAAHEMDLVVDCTELQQQVEVTVWNDVVTALDCGDEAAQWFSRFLATDCRLVYMPNNGRRLVDPQYANNQERVGFADGFPLLLISEASLDDLNSRLSSPVAMDRFRPNIVVRGCDAFAEDSWQRLRVGDLEFSVVKPCSRCVIPSIDPQTGEKHSEVLKVLAAYRRREGAVYFGQNLLHHGSGEVALGNRIEVIA